MRCAGVHSSATAPASRAARATRWPALAHRACSRSTELAALWQLPSVEYAAVPVRPQRAARRSRATRDHARAALGSGTLRDALAARLDPPRAAPPEHRRARGRRAGQVELPRRDRRRGSAPRALRRDRARSRRATPPRRRSASCPPGRTCTLLDFARPDLRLQPARRRGPGRRDRRLRRRRAEESLHRCRHPRLLRPLSAQRDHRRARRTTRARRSGTPHGCCPSARRATPTARASVAQVRALPELKEIAEFFTAELAAQLADCAQRHHRKARRARQQARAAAQLRLDQARAAQRLAAPSTSTA